MSKSRKDCGAGKKATAKEESNELRKTPGRESKAKRSKRAVELVDVVAGTISYYVDRKRFCLLKSDFEIQEPQQPHSTDWYARVDFSANVAKADAIAALKSILDEIENAGLPTTVRRIERRGADAIIRAQDAIAEVNAVYVTLPPALKIKADRISGISNGARPESLSA